MTVPLVIVVVVLLGTFVGSGSGGHGNGPLRPLKVSAPPHAEAEAKPCTALLEALPLKLKALDPRTVDPTPPTPFVVAWGDPAIVVRCGVDKPSALKPGSDAELIAGGELSGAYYYVGEQGGANIYTAVDRQAFVSFTIPAKYQGADYLPILNAAVLKAMPKAVCSTSSTELDVSKLCSRRTG